MSNNPPHDPNFPPSRPEGARSYQDPFRDTQQQYPHDDGLSFGAHDRANSGSAGGTQQPSRYPYSDPYRGSSQSLPRTGSSYNLPEEKVYDGDETYRGLDDDDEALPLKEGFGGGFYAQGQE